MAIVICLAAYVFIRYTRWGMKLNAVGTSDRASQVNKVALKRTVMLGFLLSGALAGMFAYVYYLGKGYGNQVGYNLLSLDGFNTIAIALIAYNNPIAIIFVSFLFGILTSGMTVAAPFPQFQLALQVPYLIFGILIYTAAIAVLFMKFDPWTWYRHQRAFRRQPFFLQEHERLTQAIRAARQKHRQVNRKWLQEKKTFNGEWRQKQEAYKKQHGSEWRSRWVLDHLAAQKVIYQNNVAGIQSYADAIATNKKARRFLKVTSWKTFLDSQTGCDPVKYRENTFYMNGRALDKMQLALVAAKQDHAHQKKNNIATYFTKLAQLQKDTCGPKDEWKLAYEQIVNVKEQKNIARRRWTMRWTKIILTIGQRWYRHHHLQQAKRIKQLAQWQTRQDAKDKTETVWTKTKQAITQVWFYPLKITNFNVEVAQTHAETMYHQKEKHLQKWHDHYLANVINKQQQRLTKQMVTWADRFLKSNELYQDQKKMLAEKYLKVNQNHWIHLRENYRNEQTQLLANLKSDLNELKNLFASQKKVLRVQRRLQKKATNLAIEGAA